MDANSETQYITGFDDKQMNIFFAYSPCGFGIFLGRFLSWFVYTNSPLLDELK